MINPRPGRSPCASTDGPAVRASAPSENQVVLETSGRGSCYSRKQHRTLFHLPQNGLVLGCGPA